MVDKEIRRQIKEVVSAFLKRRIGLSNGENALKEVIESELPRGAYILGPVNIIDDGCGGKKAVFFINFSGDVAIFFNIPDS